MSFHLRCIELSKFACKNDAMSCPLCSAISAKNKDIFFKFQVRVVSNFSSKMQSDFLNFFKFWVLSTFLFWKKMWQKSKTLQIRKSASEELVIARFFFVFLEFTAVLVSDHFSNTEPFRPKQGCSDFTNRYNSKISELITLKFSQKFNN